MDGMDELGCVWDALFAESPLTMQNNRPLNYDPILLKESMMIEGVHANRYSFKHLSQLIQNDKYSGLAEAGINCLFKLRREIIDTFAQVDNENDFSSALGIAKHKIVFEAFRSRLLKLGVDLDQLINDEDNSSSSKSMDTLLQCLNVIGECTQVINELRQANHTLERLTRQAARYSEIRNLLDNYSLYILK